MSNRHPLDEVVALIPHNGTALKSLTVQVGTDLIDHILYDTRLRSVGAMTPTGTSEADSFIGSRLSNEVWVGQHLDGSYVISDIQDFSLVDKPGYSLSAVLTGGLPLRDEDTATTDWTQVVTGQDTGIEPVGQFPDTKSISTIAPGVIPLGFPIDARLHFQQFADTIAQFFPGRGILEVVVRPSMRYRQSFGDAFSIMSHILPYRVVELYNGTEHPKYNFGFGWNIETVSCRFYPFDELQHDHHRVDKVIRWRSEDGRRFIEQYRFFGAVVPTSITTESQWADAKGVAPSVANGKVVNGVQFMGAALLPISEPYIQTSAAATSLRWRASTPFRLLLSSHTVSGTVIVTGALPTQTAGSNDAPAVITPTNRWKVVADVVTYIDAKANLLRRLRASVSGYEEPERTARMNAINDLDTMTDSSTRLHMYQFGGSGVPHYPDCVEQTGMYRAGRAGPILLDMLSVVVDGDDTMRSIRNRARKAVQGIGVAYLMSGDGDDLLDVPNPANGFGTALRTKLVTIPQNYRITIDATEVVVNQRKFAVQEGRVAWTALTSSQLSDLWADVLEAANRGTPIVVNSWLLLAQLMAPSLSPSDLAALSGALTSVGAGALIEERGHVAYVGRWPWDLRSTHVTAPVYFGIIAERATELFNRFYMQHAAYVRGVGRITYAPSGKMADFLLDDNVDI